MILTLKVFAEILYSQFLIYFIESYTSRLDVMIILYHITNFTNESTNG